MSMADDLLARSDATLPESTWKKFQVHYEPRTGRNGWAIETYDISEDSWERLRIVVKEGPERDPGHGTGFTRLVKDGQVWMSDTRAEIYEHFPVFNAMFWSPPGASAIINGLGLGVVVKAALHYGFRRIDVVEIDADVIDMIGPEFACSPQVRIHHADAYEITWPRGARWDIAWHDIWPTIDADNLPGMARLHRRYGRRVSWQGSWQRSLCEQLR